MKAIKPEFTSQVMSNSTSGLHPYQHATLDKLSAGGFKPGEMILYSAGRQSGKSMFSSYYYSALKKRSITTMGTNLCKEILLHMKPEPKYKFSRANWYVAEYDWVHQYEVLEWCKQQFGPHPQNPDAWSRWCNKYSEKIHFRDEKDYQWFLLKWGA